MIRYFTAAEMVELALVAGFSPAEHVSAAAPTTRYFRGRADGLCPQNNAEELVVASTS